MQSHPKVGKDLQDNLFPVDENWSQKSSLERHIASFSARDRVVQANLQIVKIADKGPLAEYLVGWVLWWLSGWIGVKA